MKLFILITLCSSFSYAGKFESPFLNFNTPDGWSCQHKAGSWNCTSPSSSKNKGIIVVTTKKSKMGNNLKTYLNKLKKPIKTIWNKKTIISQPQSVEEINIRNHGWIQATHLNSEIPNSTTKYLITIKSGLTVLVSFTAHNDDYPTLSNSFIKSIESLKLNPKLSLASNTNAINTKPVLRPQNINLGSGNELDELFAEEPIPETHSTNTITEPKNIAILLLLLLALAFYIFSKKKKR